jgi:hypothetical protein
MNICVYLYHIQRKLHGTLNNEMTDVFKEVDIPFCVTSLQ